MRLKQFIQQHMNEIMVEWVSFARTLEASTEDMTVVELRDHAEAILRSIALDIDSDQSSREQYDKSRGNASDENTVSSAASIHGKQRHESHFSLLHLSAEFRALRATVLRLWLPRVSALGPETIREMIRFNEGIDQALAESIVTFSARSDQTRDLFLAILGHDLRGPLATLIGSGEMLARPDFPAAEVQPAGARIRRSALVMSTMVKDLIGYTRTELGRGMPMDPKPEDVGAICRTAVEDAQSAYPETQFDLSSNGDLGGSFDRVRLLQLFTNLFVNAGKYGSAGKPVRVRVGGEASVVRVDVHNQGPAIPRSAWAAIFQPLVQLPGDASDQRQDRTSLGLGLYVAKEIATLHGGSIEVYSSEESGTTFSVCLPRARDTT